MSGAQIRGYKQDSAWNDMPLKKIDSSRDLLSAWVALVSRRPVPVVFSCLLAAAGLLWIAATTLAINTSTNDMLSEELPFRQNNEAVAAAFPQFVDSLIIAVEARDALAAEIATERLAEALIQQPDRFESVDLPLGGSFFRRNGLLFLSPEELQEESDRLAAAQPLLAALQEDPSLRGLTGLLEDALTTEDPGAEGVDLAPLLGRLAAVAETLPEDPAVRFSWSALLRSGGEGGEETAEDRRRFVFAKPVVDFASLAPMADAVAAVEDAARDLGLTEARGFRLRLTGEALMLQDELVSVRSGIGYVGLLSAVLVAIVLFAGLRSWRLVLPVLVTLVVGLAWTAGFAALAVGGLNLISVAFAVLFIGLSVDFGIHFVLRVQESLGEGLPQADALSHAAARIGRPLLLCAVSSSVAFFAFLPTSYRGLSELGLIAGAGMFIALFANLTLLPALLRLLPAGAGALHLGAVAAASVKLQHRAAVHARGLVGLGVVAAVAAAFVLPAAQFDDDPLNLRDPDSPSVAALFELMDDPRVTPYSAQVLVGDLDQARALAVELAKLEEVEAAVTLADFVPADQEEKLDIIDDTALFLSPLFAAPPALPSPDDAERAAALARLKAVLSEAPADLEAAAQRLRAALEALDPAGSAALETAWLSGFEPQLDRLLDALEAEDVTLESLPADLRRQHLAADGRALIQVIPTEDLRDPAARASFVDAVQPVAPNVSGVPVTIVEAGRAVVTAFAQASALALCAISLLLLIILRSPLDTLLVLLPLLLAGLATAAVGVVFGLPFNFANVIVLPLLLGLGVDSGIHYVMRAREVGSGQPSHTNSTPRAIFLSAITTVASFGALAFSQHPGTASMGLLLTIGIAITLFCVLIFLPALLVLAGRLPRG